MTTKKTAAKTVKPAAKTKTTKPIAAAAKPSKPAKQSVVPKAPPTHDEIAHLARQYWIEGGHREGNAEQDWQRAEHELSHK
jgi:hypothetical protein